MKLTNFQMNEFCMFFFGNTKISSILSTVKKKYYGIFSVYFSVYW